MSIFQRVRSVITTAAERPTEHATTHNEKPRESGQGAPGQEDNRNATSTSRRHNSIGQTGRRTGLRTHDQHASWREVYAACHVEHRR